MAEEGDAYDKGICKVQTRHGGQLVDILAPDPDTLSIALSHSVVEAERRGQQAWRHAREEAETQEGGKVGQSHCSTSHSKGGMVGGRVVVPGEEAEQCVSIGGRLLVF